MQIFRKPKDAGDWFSLSMMIFGAIMFIIAMINIIK